MLSIFPPVLDARGLAFPYTGVTDLEIKFYVPMTTDSSLIKHIEVMIRYKDSGAIAINPNGPNCFDKQILYYDFSSSNIDTDTRIGTLLIPYSDFESGNPKSGRNYLIQIRFGASTKPTGVDSYATWYREQVTAVPSKLGEWSNSQTRFCFRSQEALLSISDTSFLPEPVLSFESDEGDSLESCDFTYSFNFGNSAYQRTIHVSASTTVDNISVMRTTIPVAPFVPIVVTASGVTSFGQAINCMTTVEAVSGGSGCTFEEMPLNGTESEDGVIGKIVSGVADNINIYRVNIFTLECAKIIKGYNATGAISFKDFSIEMGEDYLYVAVEETDDSFTVKSKISPLGFGNPAYGRLMQMDSILISDKSHQLRIQGNVSVSNFKRNTSDVFQTTIGSKFPFYSRSAEMNYRSLSVNGVISINFNKTGAFFENDPNEGLWWRSDNENRLQILNRDIYGESQFTRARVRYNSLGYDGNYMAESIIEPDQVDETTKRGPLTIYGDYLYRSPTAFGDPFSDEMVFIERKFRESVMSWLSNGKPKLFRSETEGNMICIISGVSFSPLDKTGRSVYTASMTVTEIDENNVQNLIDYNLLPLEIKFKSILPLPTYLETGDIVNKATYDSIIGIDSSLTACFTSEGNIYKVNGTDLALLLKALASITEYTFINGNPDPNASGATTSGINFIVTKIMTLGVKHVGDEVIGIDLREGVFPVSARDSATFTGSGHGLSISGSVLSGTVSGTGSDGISISVNGGAATGIIPITVIDKLTISDSNPSFTVSGGLGPYKIYGNKIPSGMVLKQINETTVELSGAATRDYLAAYKFEICAKDSYGGFASVEVNGSAFVAPAIIRKDPYKIAYVVINGDAFDIDVSTCVDKSDGAEYTFSGSGSSLVSISNDGIATITPPSATTTDLTYTVSVTRKLGGVSSATAATFNIVIGAVIDELTADETAIKTVLNPLADDMIVGTVFEKLDIYNKADGTKTITGGFPFYDSEGNPYYKYKTTGFYPDFKIEKSGVCSGRAAVENASRTGTITIIDAVGQTVDVSGITIGAILPAIVVKAGAIPSNKIIPKSYVGSSDTLEFVVDSSLIEGGTSPTLAFKDETATYTGVSISGLTLTVSTSAEVPRQVIPLIIKEGSSSAPSQIAREFTVTVEGVVPALACSTTSISINVDEWGTISQAISGVSGGTTPYSGSLTPPLDGYGISLDLANSKYNANNIKIVSSKVSGFDWPDPTGDPPYPDVTKTINTVLGISDGVGQAVSIPVTIVVTHKY